MNAQNAQDPYRFWRAAIATGKPIETERGSPRAGYYRVNDEAIAFVSGELGDVYVWRSGTFPTPTQADAIDEMFGFAAPHPVKYEDFEFFTTSGRWPDQIAPVEVAADLSPHEKADAELTAQREAMAAWFKSIGGKITVKPDADKVGNFADEFAKIEKKATAEHKAEKEPFLEGGRIVDQKWKPIIERAKELKTWAKDSTTPYLKAEKARIDAEAKARADEIAKVAREAEEARRKAEATGAPPPAPAPAPVFAPPPEKAKASKVHLRSETVYEVTDPAAFLRWLSAQNSLPEDFLAMLKTLGTRMVKAGLAPDGVVTKIEERAA